MLIDSAVLTRPTYVAGQIVTQVEAGGPGCLLLHLDHALGVLRVRHLGGEDWVPMSAIAVIRVSCVVDPGAGADAGSTVDPGADAGSTVDPGAGADAGSTVDPGADADAGSTVDPGADADADVVRRAVVARGRARAQDCASDLGWDVPRVSRALRDLVSRGVLDCAGRTRGKIYWPPSP